MVSGRGACLFLLRLLIPLPFFQPTRSPDDSKIKQKMLYASSKDALRKSLVGISSEIQGTDMSEVAHETGESAREARAAMTHADPWRLPQSSKRCLAPASKWPLQPLASQDAHLPHVCQCRRKEIVKMEIVFTPLK